MKIPQGRTPCCQAHLYLNPRPVGATGKRLRLRSCPSCGKWWRVKLEPVAKLMVPGLPASRCWVVVWTRARVPKAAPHPPKPRPKGRLRSFKNLD